MKYKTAETIIDYITNNPGSNRYQIAKETNLSYSMVSNAIHKLLEMEKITGEIYEKPMSDGVTWPLSVYSLNNVSKKNGLLLVNPSDPDIKKRIRIAIKILKDISPEAVEILDKLK